MKFFCRSNLSILGHLVNQQASGKRARIRTRSQENSVSSCTMSLDVVTLLHSGVGASGIVVTSLWSCREANPPSGMKIARKHETTDAQPAEAERLDRSSIYSVEPRCGVSAHGGTQ